MGANEEKDVNREAGSGKAGYGLTGMRKRGSRGLAFAEGMALMALLLIGGQFLCLTLAPARPGSLSSLRKVREIEGLIEREYLNEIDEKKQTDYMMLGMVAGLEDPYSAYYTRDQYEEVKKAHSGKMEGVGITISEDRKTGDLVIVKVTEGSPAEAAGLLADDRLLSVNGESLEGKSGSDAAGMIQSAEEKRISMVVFRADPSDAGKGREISVSMERTTLNLPVVSGEMKEDQIGYIRIETFNAQTPDQFGEAYRHLTDQGMEGLVIDLRDNLGGLVDACCDTLSQFMPRGVLVLEEDKNGRSDSRDCEGKTPIEIPLVLLVNQNTASASEMFTGAVQDHGVGRVVGTQTYGKGVEQASFVLQDGSVVKLTTLHYFTPDHRDINGVGIRPDRIVEEGDQLNEAVKLLRSMVDGEKK